MLEKMKSMGGSRRFWAGLITSVVVYVNSQLNLLPSDQMLAIAGIISAAIIGDSMRPIGQ